MLKHHSSRDSSSIGLESILLLSEVSPRNQIEAQRRERGEANGVVKLLMARRRRRRGT